MGCKQGRLAQLVEHSLDVRMVSGSIPLASTTTHTVETISFIRNVFVLCIEIAGRR